MAITIAFQARWDGAGAGDVFIGKASGINSGWRVATDSTNHMGLTRGYGGTTPGVWSGGTAINASTRHYILSHDGVVTSDPRIVIDGVAETVTEDVAPSGSLDADAATNMIAGESSSGANDFDGALQNLVIADSVWTSAEENRHRWWGCAPGGPSTVKVWHPFYTEALANKGTATATGTATGTSVASLPLPTVRPGMGMGW